MARISYKKRGSKKSKKVYINQSDVLELRKWIDKMIEEDVRFSQNETADSAFFKKAKSVVAPKIRILKKK